MDVFLMIRRQKTTIFTDAKETTTVLELKKMIQGIVKVAPDDQQLCDESGSEIFDNSKTLLDYNLSGKTARAHTPACVGLCFRNESGEFEKYSCDAYSCPPDLPEVLKQDSALHE